MRLLVTGSAGFVGRQFCRAALARGHEVVAADRRPTGIEHPNIRILVSDVRRLTVDDLHGADAIVHFATGKAHFLSGEQSGAAAYRAVLEETVGGTRHVCELAMRAGVRRVVHISSMTVYPGPVPEEGRRDSIAAFDPRPEHRGLYAHSKVLAEAEVHRFAGRTPMHPELCVLRLALVCGPGMGHEPESREQSLCLTLISAGKPVPGGFLIGIGRPSHGAPLLAVGDLIDGILSLIGMAPQAGSLRVWDVQSCEPPAKRDLLQAYAAAIGRRHTQVWPPRVPTLAFALAAELMFRLQGRRTHLPYRIGRAYRFDARALSHTAFWDDTGVTPRGTLGVCLAHAASSEQVQNPLLSGAEA